LPPFFLSAARLEALRISSSKIRKIAPETDNAIPGKDRRASLPEEYEEVAHTTVAEATMLIQEKRSGTDTLML